MTKRAGSELPQDLEVALKGAARGERLIWAGRTSSVPELFQGWAILLLGVVTALSLSPSLIAALGLWLSWTQSGEMPALPALGIVGLAVFAMLSGVGLIVWGRNWIKHSDRIVWAVTPRHLIRMAHGAWRQPTRYWTKGDIIRIERKAWDRPKHRMLAVLVKGREDNRWLFIMGAPDLEVAEQAILALEA